MTYESDEEDQSVSQEAIRNHLEQSVQDGIQMIRDFIVDTDEVVVGVVAETKFNNDIHNIVIYTDEEPRPLSFITLFEQNLEASEAVANHIRKVLVSCGFEVVDEDGRAWEFEQNDMMTEMFDFISSEHTIAIASEYFSSDDAPYWSISISANEKEIEILRLEKVSDRSVGAVERQLAMFLAAMDKTVQISDGSRINIYGYVLSPLDV
jgi:hypothetical protein